MKNSNAKLFAAVVLGLTLCFSTILIAFYLIAMNTGLPGRRGGPQDAFRHTYACAMVTKFISPIVVRLVTKISERNPKSPFDAMDIHNNNIGIQIGLSATNVYETVKRHVEEGQIHSNSKEIITWLPEEKWTNGF